MGGFEHGLDRRRGHRRAQTLEWATTSPPPRHNFTAALPAIRSHAPLLDLREEAIL
jgi:heme/copper-type cytochrome/quinol oxidase subunit 1